MAGLDEAAPPQQHLTPWRRGQLVAGKFRLLRELGRGGMGAVWAAEHLSLGAPVAIKLIAPQSAESTLGVVRFVREAKAAAALRSPHVVQTLDHGVDGSVPYIVMELLEGESLQARLERRGRLDDRETLRVVTHIARALTKAQDKGIVHRDLKPANVFVVQAGDEEIVKVLDFGVAKDVAGGVDTYETKTGTVVGTPKYMSPEQARGRRVDWRSDLWSLAVIAYQCHLGREPFEATVLAELLLQICSDPLPVPSEHAEVAPGFDAWWSRAAQRDPQARFQSATEMVEALRAVLTRSGDPAALTRSGDSAAFTRSRGDSTAAEPPKAMAADSAAVEPSQALAAEPVAAALAEASANDTIGSRSDGEPLPQLPLNARVPWGWLGLAAALALVVGLTVSGAAAERVRLSSGVLQKAAQRGSAEAALTLVGGPAEDGLRSPRHDGAVAVGTHGGATGPAGAMAGSDGSMAGSGGVTGGSGDGVAAGRGEGAALAGAGLAGSSSGAHLGAAGRSGSAGRHGAGSADSRAAAGRSRDGAPGSAAGAAAGAASRSAAAGGDAAGGDEAETKGATMKPSFE